MLDVAEIDSFYGRAQILHGIGFSLAAGEAVALLGRNGAGKSTTIKSVIQLVRPSRGRVVFEGQEIAGLPAYRVARLGIGYVPEDRRVFPELTVRENLEVGRRTAPAGVDPWTSERLYTLFPNLAERRNQPGKAMSGGEQQMLTIARTLMGNPRLLLLDEPSEGLAPVIVEQMAETLIALKAQGLTLLLSEQNLHFARLIAERALVIEGGRLRFDGTLAALEADQELLQDTLAV